MSGALLRRRRPRLPARSRLRRLGPFIRAHAVTARAAAAPGPRMRRRLLAIGVLALAVSALYMLWLRDSGLVAVEKVTVTGLTGKNAAEIRSALDATGRQMTTLHVDEDRLTEAAVAFPAVKAIEVEPDFPTGLVVHVIEHRPAALVVADGRRVLVAGDGSVLPGQTAQGSVPDIKFDGAVSGGRLTAGPTLDLVRVAGVAPLPLLERVAEVRQDETKGIVATLDDGPDLIFGTPDRIGAKWAAAARVLADPDAAGAEYLDLRIPGRPAAGGLPVETLEPVAPAGSPEPAAPLVDPGVAAPAEPLAEPEVAPAEPVPAPEESVPLAPEQAPVTPAEEPPASVGGGADAYPQP